MKCPFCGEDNDRVIDSRSGEGGEFTKRRRECLACGKRFPTIERIDIEVPAVIKVDGRRETFSREKILRGLRAACTKRPVSTESLERIAEEVERAAANSGQSEVHSSFLGGIVMQRLREIDDIAYIRFASVYRRIEDVESLLAEAEGIKSGPRPTEEQPKLPL